MELSQFEADLLFRSAKFPLDKSQKYDFPIHGEKLKIPLIGTDDRTEYLLDVHHIGAQCSKITYQNRVRSVVQLRRLDLNTQPHRNPDEVPPLEILNDYVGKEIPAPHVHLYIQGWADKWAIPAELELSCAGTWYDVLKEFILYCNIQNLTIFNNRLLL